MKWDFFWKHFDQPYRSLYQTLLVLFAGSVLAYALTYLWGSSFVINWEITNTIQPVKSLFSSYSLGLFTFPIPIDNFVILQNFMASDLQIHTWPAYVLLVWLALFISFILSLITDLSRFWFVVALVLFTLLLVGLKLDYLVLFQQYNKIALVIAFALYFPPLYVFHFIKKDVGMGWRFIVHLSATAVFALIIYKFSAVSLPFLHLASYGIYVPLILTIIFTFVVGHEIISSLLRVISNSTIMGDKGSHTHFLIISVIFLLNIALLLLKNTRTISLGIYLIGAFLVLTAAAFIGIWGYKEREVTYQGMFPFYPAGAFLYLLLAINAHITLAYFFISGNDFLVEVVEDAIVFSQLAYGVLFVVYFIANFYDLLKHNVNVAKVVYSPRRMPYFTSRLAGLIAILALFFRFHMTPYYQAVAGFYSGIGDLYLKMEDHNSAKEYYTLSNIYSSTSHRANFAMATMEKRSENQDEEIRYLKLAVEKNPTEYAYANLAARLKAGKRSFEALFALQEGLEEFPKSGHLMNNLGLMYLDLQNVDSAYYYLNNAASYRSGRNTSETNVYALLRMKNLSIREDTLDYLLGETDYLPAVNNLVVLANELKKKTPDKGGVRFGEVETTGIDQIVYNYNKTLNSPELVDSVYRSEMKIFYDSGNTSWFQDNLMKAAALALYDQGNLTDCYQMLNHLAIQNPTKEYYSLLGKLSLLQNADGLALDYFKESFRNGHPDIAPELAFAYMKYGEPDKAAFVWRQVAAGGDSAVVNIARKMLAVIVAERIDDVLYADTETRYSFIAYRSREFDTQQLEALVLSFENEDVQAMAFNRLFDVYLELGRQEQALSILEKLSQLNISMPKVLQEINLAQCRYAYYFNEKEIMERLRQNLPGDDMHVNNFLQLFSSMNQPDTLEAIRGFVSAAEKNPFFEPGIYEALKYLNNIEGHADQAYELVLNAVNTNPFSIALNKAYALQCIRAGLISYAMDTKEELRQMMTSVAFMTFEQEFDRVMAEYETESSTW
jgi:tetratricopeptide (TPR) repeat protein